MMMMRTLMRTLMPTRLSRLSKQIYQRGVVGKKKEDIERWLFFVSFFYLRNSVGVKRERRGGKSSKREGRKTHLW